MAHQQDAIPTGADGLLEHYQPGAACGDDVCSADGQDRKREQLVGLCDCARAGSDAAGAANGGDGKAVEQATAGVVDY